MTDPTATPTANYNWLKPHVGGSTSTWGQTLNDDLDAIDAQVFAAANPAGLIVSSTPGTAVKGTLTFANSSAPTGQKTRWVLAEDTVTESGSNAGSNLSLTAYSDAGVALFAPLSFMRSTGAATFSGAVNVTGALNVTGATTLSGGIAGTPSFSGAATFSSTVTVSGVAQAGEFVCGHGNAFGIINNTNGFCYDPTHGAVFENTDNPPLYSNKIGTNGVVALFMQSGIGCGSITVADALTTAFNTTSDARLKKDEKSFDAGPIIDQIEVYDFAWTATGERTHGVFAQEVQEVYPDAVTHDEKQDWWGVDYSKFVPLLLKEIQSLRARVAALEAR